MYSPSNVEEVQRSSDLYIAQGERVELPAIFTPESSAEHPELFNLPEDGEQDQEQKLSQQLRRSSGLHLQVESVPTPSPDPFFLASPVSLDDISETNLSMSPAAMFLSAFSPSTASRPLPDDEGEMVCGYILGPIIGYGGFSVIRRAVSPKGDAVAIKIVRHADIDKYEDPERARKHLAHEAAVWSSLCHENILPLFTSSHTPYADFFVTLYCPAGSLFDILKRDGRPGLSLDEAGRMFRQVVKGLRYMHEIAGYVHGDMKLENVLVDEMGVCRITDFGMARKIGECESDGEEDERRTSRSSRTVSLRPSQSLRQKRSRSRQPMPGALSSHLSLLRHHGGTRYRTSSPLPGSATPVPNQVFQPGSLPYASPELLLPSSSAEPYRPHPAQDIWALGVMLYVLLSGKMPFADSFEPRLQMKILHGAYELPQGIGRGAERVLVGCLQRSVHDRWTVAMVDEVIEWGETGIDEDAPSPTEMLPPRSLSRNPPTVHEEVVLDDIETSHSQPIPIRQSSRSRSGRSRSRSAAYHPYLHEPHTNAQQHHEPPQPSLSGLNNAILRSISSSSSGSGFESALHTSTFSEPEEHGPLGVMPTFRSISRSRSPPDSPLTPLDISAAYRARGRKKSSRSVRPPLNDSALHDTSREPGEAQEDDHLQLPPRWARSPDSVAMETNSPRSSSHDPYETTRGTARRSSVDTARRPTRAGSVPPTPSRSASWALEGFKTVSAPGSTSAAAQGQLTGVRSRSAGFASDSERMASHLRRQLS